MATLNEYIYEIKGLVRNYHITDEDYLTNRQIEFWIVTQRASWIKKRDRLFIHNDHSLMQTIIADVHSVDRSFESTNDPVHYKILRTATQIPKTINFESWDGISMTGSVDMASPRFNHVEYQEAIYSGNGRFNRDQIYSYSMNRYLYMISRSYDNYWKLITKVAITGIFEDPRDVAEFSHVNGQPCWTPDDEYPMSIELWDYMKAEIIRSNIDALVKIPVDQANDDNEQKRDTP